MELNTCNNNTKNKKLTEELLKMVSLGANIRLEKNNTNVIYIRKVKKMKIWKLKTIDN